MTDGQRIKLMEMTDLTSQQTENRISQSGSFSAHQQLYNLFIMWVPAQSVERLNGIPLRYWCLKGYSIKI